MTASLALRLLAGAEFWLSQDDKGRILGNLRLNPATTNPHTVTILLGLLNEKVGRHRVWYTHPRHGWRHICWRGGWYAHFWSLQKRCEESNIDSQRQDTLSLMQRQWESEQAPPEPEQIAPPETIEPPESVQSAEDEPTEPENVWLLRARAHRAINSMNVSALQAFFTLVEAAKSPRPSRKERGTSITSSLPEPETFARPSSSLREATNTSTEKGTSMTNTLPELEMPTRPSSPRPKAMGTSIANSSPKPSRTQASSKTIASENRPYYTRIELEATNIRALKKLAVGTGIKRYSRLRKAQLVEALLDWQFERQYELELDKAHHVLSKYST